MTLSCRPASTRTLPVADAVGRARPGRGPARRTAARSASLLGLHALAAVAGLSRPASARRDRRRRSATGHDRLEVDQLALLLAASLVVQTVLTWFARRASFVLGETVLRRAARAVPRARARAAAVDGRAGRHRRPGDPHAPATSRRCRAPCASPCPSVWSPSSRRRSRSVAALARRAGSSRCRCSSACRCSWLSTRWYLRCAPGRLPARARPPTPRSTASSPRPSTAPAPSRRCGLGAPASSRIDADLAEAYDAERYTLGLRLCWFPTVEFAYALPGRGHPAVGRLPGRPAARPRSARSPR